MARSIKKGPFVDLHLVKKVDTARASGDKRPIKVFILEFFIHVLDLAKQAGADKLSLIKKAGTRG